MSRPSGSTGRRSGALVALLVAGLALRVIIAYLLPGSGFGVDINAFAYWAANLAQQGPWGFYDRPFFHDYTPGYLYVLWLLGYLGQALGGLGDLIKVPAILADLVLAWLAYDLARELGSGERRALLAAGLVLFIPITWFDSAVWGQVDSVGVVFLLLALRATWRDQPERAAVFGTIAAIVKPQLGIIIPIVAAVVISRAIAARRAGREQLEVSGGERPSSFVARLRAWSERERGPVRILTTAIAGLVTAVLVCLPFGLTIVGLAVQVVTTAAGYPYVTVNAYNPWALVARAGQGLAATGAWLCDVTAPGTCAAGGVAFGPVPALLIGSALILAVVIVVSVIVARRPDRLTILVGLTVLAVAFFVVPTRVHERYLYPFVILGAILAAASARWLVAYLAITTANFLNLYVVLTSLYQNPGVRDWLGIGAWIRSYQGVAIIALVHLVGFLWVAAQLRRSASDRLATELEEAGAEESEGPRAGAVRPAPTTIGRPAVAGAVGGGLATVALPSGAFAATGALGAAGASSIAGERTAADEPAPGAGRDALIDRLPPWLRPRPVRRDRSADLASEKGGRFDRLDLWVVVVLLLVTAVLRGYRLEEPFQMHFDEVYHARTATEFLQKWRYGIDHSIYEYTHPHLAKYAMAAGIVLFGGDGVSATSELGTTVRAATIEPRWDDPRLPDARAGDRLYVATGSDVRVLDLMTRAAIATIPAPGAQAVAVDTAGHRLLIGTSAGAILALDTSTTLDQLRLGGAAPDLTPTPFAALGAPVDRLLVTADGTAVAAASGQQLTILDGGTGTVRGRQTIAGLGGLAEAGTSDALVAEPANIADPSLAASALASVAGGSAASYEPLLRSSAGTVTMPIPVNDSNRSSIQAAIANGSLGGFSIESAPRIAAAGTAGVTFVSSGDGSRLSAVSLDAPATDVVSVTGVSDPEIYAAQGTKVAVILVGGASAAQPRLDSTIQMPGRVSRILFDKSSLMVHVLGERQDGGGETVYVIEPHGNAVYADAPIPGTAAAWAMDQAPDHPSSDRQQLLVLSAEGTTWSIDVGGHAAAWRIPGVILGVLTAVLLYLFARLLFRRRAVAVVLAAVVAVDPMLFVQSRIGMNDVYAGFFIAAGLLVFAALWTNAWRWRGAFWVAMPLVGILLGLGLSSKWVGAYAIGAVGLLYLARSALGRIVLLLAMVALTTVLGFIAVSVPGGQTGGPNLTFLLIMLALTLLAFVLAVLRPVRWSDEEVAFAVGAPVAAGVLLFLAALAVGAGGAAVTLGGHGVPVVAIAFGLVVLGGLVYLAFQAAGRMGFGPAAPPRSPDDPASLLPPPSPPPPPWLRPGWRLGLPFLYFLATAVVVPLVVYVIVYIPWAFVDSHRLWADMTLPIIGFVPSWPPGHDGQTLVDLTAAMYNYHNTLRATHPAASPWWAWPFDLKPVWFYQGSFASNMAAAIYDHGSLVTWWLAIPAMLFAAYQAFRRNSLALGFIVIVFVSMWVPWMWIDRATFQYHWYTSLPLMLMALAYLIAELWHGPSARVWLLARASAAVALMGPVILWLFKGPLCAIAGVEKVYPNSPACIGNPGSLVVTGRVAVLGLVTVVAAAILLWQLLHVARPRDGRRRGALDAVAGMAITAAVAVILIVLAGVLVPDTPVLSLPGIPAELLALILAIPLGGVAWISLSARDARRFAVGVLVAATVWTIILYPNIAALPMPDTVYNAYQGILPTYLYPFQFAVNTEPAVTSPPILAPGPALLFVAILLTSLVVTYSAYVWRITLAEREAARAGRLPGPSAGA